MFPIYFSNKMPALPMIPLPRDSTLFSSDPPFDPSSPTSLSYRLPRQLSRRSKGLQFISPYYRQAPRARRTLASPSTSNWTYTLLDRPLLHLQEDRPQSRPPRPLCIVSTITPTRSIFSVCLATPARHTARTTTAPRPRQVPTRSPLANKSLRRRSYLKKEKIGQQISKRKKTDVTGHVMRTVAHVLPRRI